MIDMELSDLRIFMAVADELGFTAAAKKLNFVQPNVTGRIKKLEEELGVQLFYRKNRKVSLTPYGRQFHGYAERIIRLSREAVRSLQSGTPSGPLSIGVTQTVASAYLPEILRVYHSRFPEVELTVRTIFHNSLHDCLLDHTVDYALVEIPVDHPELVIEHAWPQKLVIVSAPNYPVKDNGVTALVFSSTCPYFHAMLDAFQRENIVVARQLKLLNVDAVLACAMGGVGVTVLPQQLVNRDHIAPFVRTRPIAWEAGNTSIKLVRHKESTETPQGLAFCRVVRESMETLVD
jgi:DNA-binding transcriptional LysR family regulator